MTGRSVNIYLQEDTYRQLQQLVGGRKISRFVNEAVNEKLQQRQQEKKQELQIKQQQYIFTYNTMFRIYVCCFNY